MEVSGTEQNLNTNIVGVDNDKEAEKKTLTRGVRELEKALGKVLFTREEMVSRGEMEWYIYIIDHIY